MNDLSDLPDAAEGEALPKDTAEPQAPLHPSLPLDEFHGVAGTYVFDPATGQRTRVADAP